MNVRLLRLSKRCFHISSVSTQEQVMNVFDRKTKGFQRERAANLENVDDFDYMKEEQTFLCAIFCSSSLSMTYPPSGNSHYHDYK